MRREFVFLFKFVLITVIITLRSVIYTILNKHNSTLTGKSLGG